MSQKKAQKDARVPVTILTGFLGSGKTTLLNHILHEQKDMKLAIIENEFGAVGVDDVLLKDREKKNNSAVLEEAEEEIIEMMNGCVCCTVRKDLIVVVKKILAMKSKKKFDGILIETTGLADPAPVAQTFFVDEVISKLTVLDAIITVVDSKNILTRLADKKEEGVENEALEQVAFADKIILNKMDLVDEKQVVEIKQALKSINSHCEIIEATQSKVDPARLFNIRGFSLDRVLEKEPDFLAEDGGDHLHDKSVTSVSFQTDEPINVGQLQNWIEVMITTKGTDLFRYKGVINVKGMHKKFVFQGVHMLFTGEYGAMWKKDESRFSRFVFIGRNLDHDELTKGFMACKAAEKLRFAVGDTVDAKQGRGYKRGTVIKLWDEGNPYRIRLDSGLEVWGHTDDDSLVRAPRKLRKSERKSASDAPGEDGEVAVEKDKK